MDQFGLIWNKLCFGRGLIWQPGGVLMLEPCVTNCPQQQQHINWPKSPLLYRLQCNYAINHHSCCRAMFFYWPLLPGNVFYCQLLSGNVFYCQLLSGTTETSCRSQRQELRTGSRSSRTTSRTWRRTSKLIGAPANDWKSETKIQFALNKG